MTKITYTQGKIEEQFIDAVVNAANTTLMGGGGVDGAIHKKAGMRLRFACIKLGGCKTGQAKLTDAYKLPARYIIHTVGPMFGMEDGDEETLLADCYRNSLNIAAVNSIRTIAFPCISTGAFKYPSQEAAEIAVRTVKEVVSEQPEMFDEIRFVTFSEDDTEIYRKLLATKE